jgi:hypothetical protein
MLHWRTTPPTIVPAAPSAAAAPGRGLPGGFSW